MARPKIFVSFSSRDLPFVQRLFARLGAQEVELWDYSQEGQEIPLGEDLEEYLRRRVENVEVFVPVVTPNSFGSRYTRAEVRHAL
ncbi:MAG: toll/interleukin-1 receptor domain-containing protein, partial [Deferrisomatales bacterium]